MTSKLCFDIDFKKDHIICKFSLNERLIMNGVLSILSMLISRQFGLKGSLNMIRNGTMSYFGLGFFVVPEIYNPIMNWLWIL